MVLCYPSVDCTPILGCGRELGSFCTIGLSGEGGRPAPPGKLGSFCAFASSSPAPLAPSRPALPGNWLRFARLALFDTRTGGQIGFVSHNRVFPRARLAGNWVRFAHLTPANWLRFAHFVLRGHSRPEELASFCIICTAVLRPITDYRLPPTAFWLRFGRLAQVKAWNSYSIGGIVALRCFKKPENRMLRHCGSETPARPVRLSLRAGSSAVTTGRGGPSASGVWPSMRHSEEDASRCLYVTQKSKFRQKFSPLDQPSPEGERQ